jgi:ribosomal protein S18 acetylase RimI-like enzyme
MQGCEEDLSIAEITQEDLPVVAGHILREFPYTKMTEDKLKARFSANDTFLYKLVRGKTLLGFIDFEVLEGTTGRITGVVVPEEHRSRNCGRMLMAFALSRLREIGCKKAVLTVSDDNGEAISLYTSCGFTPVRESARQSGGYNVFDMELMLPVNG